MDGLSSTEFAFVAALYLFAPTALQAQQGDFGQMLRAASPGETRRLILDADVRAHLEPGNATQLADAAATRRRRLEAEREAFAAMTASWRRQRLGIMAAPAGGAPAADMVMHGRPATRPLVASTTPR
jgi:hypothetical protein